MWTLRDQEKFALKCAQIISLKWGTKIIPITFVLFDGALLSNHKNYTDIHRLKYESLF